MSRKRPLDRFFFRRRHSFPGLSKLQREWLSEALRVYPLFGGTVGPLVLPEKRTMKKFLTAGLVASALMLASHQQVSAWTNFRFGIGLNVEWQSGGNSFLWG